MRFAHNTERQFAKLLDFYGIVWHYEPRTFVLEWDKEGRSAQAFTPDFYLPAVRRPSPSLPGPAGRCRRRRRLGALTEQGAFGPAAGDPPLPHTTIRFAHNSELQFAKLLDFYGIVWEYEPRQFVLEWDGEGRSAQAFTPDFYLPAYDLFIEITTMNQKLVTKKNRKARRLKELYPDVNIRVLYQRDYLNLLVKYGLEPPSQSIPPVDESVEPLPLRFAKAAEDAPPARQHRRRPA